MSSHPVDPEGHKMNILVVDDNEMNRKALRVNLQAEGYAITEAADGVRALEVLEMEPMDVIVSDVLMPRMDGYRLCYEVRRNKKLQHLPFIVYSSTYNSPADEKLAREFGADVFIKKPAGIQEFLAVIHKVTREASTRLVASSDAVSELTVMDEYSRLLVRKLEQKNTDLEQAHAKLISSNQDLTARTAELERMKEELRRANDALESRVRQRTAALETVNSELEAFSYSVSHDLRAPLRSLDGFTKILLDDESIQLSPSAQHSALSINEGVSRMGRLIDDLLAFARSSRQTIQKETVDVSRLTDQIVDDLRREHGNRNIEVRTTPLPAGDADPALLRQVLVNLLSNAFKFTRGQDPAVIEIASHQDGPEQVYLIRDNGAGFDMRCAQKLFGVFQRLHTGGKFEGTGVGLSIAQRIILRHGGRIWAEAEVGKGATFCFTLGPIAPKT